VAIFDPSAVLGQVAQGYLKLPITQKVVFPLLIIASIAGIIFVSQWASRPDYVILYSDLQPADSAAVIERLKSLKIKYDVRDGGNSIAITPPEMVSELRISLAAEGIPKSGTAGFELLDGTNFGMTAFKEVVNYQRALQGELERTITSLDAVTSARVHIVQPEKTVFSKRGNVATASVMLKLRPGAQLEPKQIKGISNLISGSVEGLKTENVSIIDVFGNLLTTKDEGQESLTLEATRLQYQREVERGYADRIEQMLSKVLGSEKVIARVTAELDFSLNEREEESYDPGGQVMRSERTIEEGVGTSQRGGVPGVVSNLSNDPKVLAPQGASGDDSQRREAVKNYEVSRAVSKISSPRGTLKRVSVAVLVDGTYENIDVAGNSANKTDPKAAAPEKVFKPLESEMLTQIEDVVKNAVGYDAARGDSITVENIPFLVPETDFIEEMDKAALHDSILKYVQKGSPILFMLLFFFFLVRPLVGFLVTPTEAEVDLSRLLPKGIQELEKELDSERQKAVIPAYEPAVDLAQLEEMMGENSRIVKDNPQQAALLIRYWLNDGRL
jgi:flagellar M-ring protein FliF